MLQARGATQYDLRENNDWRSPGILLQHILVIFIGQNGFRFGGARHGKKVPVMKLSPTFYVFTSEAKVKLMWRKTMMKMTFAKQPPLLEDLRNHTSEQLAELRLLLDSNAASRPDPRRPGFYEIDGEANVFYIFRYPSGSKVLLIGVWERDRVAELAACSCLSAA
jgi:hypothetical protein